MCRIVRTPIRRRPYRGSLKCHQLVGVPFCGYTPETDPFVNRAAKLKNPYD
ncbi:hypothetical protein I41_28380 [Lacipirellula limnantheis]|uniref:Uncharacterized protein n=1 Tax=Lacipirellula limnantheis TaxID=2528024 RepID=A0A517TZ46_9BACT|nr:hypothetical protein I41_28380 [Lacipirellula limnantheis]